MEVGVLFSNLTINDKKLDDCVLVHECADSSYRLYASIEKNSFHTLAVAFNSCLAEDKDHWKCRSLRVEPLFSTIAYFDGVRHLEFNSYADYTAGYIYYPNIQGLIELFQKVRELECDMCDSPC